MNLKIVAAQDGTYNLVKPDNLSSEPQPGKVLISGLTTAEQAVDVQRLIRKVELAAFEQGLGQAIDSISRRVGEFRQDYANA
jgi:hypothetical protein